VNAFPGEKLSARGCRFLNAFDWSSGCKDNQEYQGRTGRICLCDTDLCNAATMTSSLGHVIVMAVALFITARLM